MDKNKQEKMQSVGYRILPACGLCRYLELHNPESAWGTCMQHQYSHLKHSDDVRNMSVCIFGHCPLYEESQAANILLGRYREFFSKE